jgi:glycerol-3-phosphate acyltransferase PlsX
MGGDFGPEVAIPAALMALKQHDNLKVILVGDESLITKGLETFLDQPEPRCSVQHAGEPVKMHTSSLRALHDKTGFSMRVALDLVRRKKATACVSAGNASSLIAAAHSVLKKLPGIDQPAISVSLPTLEPNRNVRLLDVGANADAQIKNLLQFADMGLVLSREIDEVASPKLALLDIGVESAKKNSLLREAGQEFSKKAEALGYMGYIEGDSLFNGDADVVVCDGFTGNVVLKIMEGIAKLLNVRLKKSLNKGSLQLASKLMKPFLGQIEAQLNVNYYNGASIVGLQGIVIKSHKKANAQAFNCAIQKALAEIQQNLPGRIQTCVGEFSHQ